jgi:Mg-chelatase subunit ChlD
LNAGERKCRGVAKPRLSIFGVGFIFREPAVSFSRVDKAKVSTASKRHEPDRSRRRGRHHSGRASHHEAAAKAADASARHALSDFKTTRALSPQPSKRPMRQRLRSRNSRGAMVVVPNMDDL